MGVCVCVCVCVLGTAQLLKPWEQIEHCHLHYPFHMDFQETLPLYHMTC